MTLEKPGRPGPWKVHPGLDGAVCVTIVIGGATGGFMIYDAGWTPIVWKILAEFQRDEDKLLALERASAINHRTEWFDHYGHRHVGWARR